VRAGAVPAHGQAGHEQSGSSLQLIPLVALLGTLRVEAGAAVASSAGVQHRRWIWADWFMTPGTDSSASVVM
jgi:hypothetical protein